MKTAFFRKLVLDPSTKCTFLKDFKILLKLKTGSIISAIKKVFTLALEKGFLNKDGKDALAKSLELDIVDLDSVISVSFFLLNNLSEKDLKNDQADDLAKDFIEFVSDREDKDQFGAAKVLSLFELILELIPPYEEAYRKTAYETRILPNLKSVSTAVDLRAVQTDPFCKDDKIDSYRSQIEGHIPIVLVRLVLDDEDFSPCIFQLSPPKLKRMIENLSAALKDLDKFESFVKSNIQIQNGSKC